MPRYDVNPAPTDRQNKPYPVYQFTLGTAVILEADAHSCYVYAFGYVRGMYEFEKATADAR